MMNLVGANNSGTPATQFDVSADLVVLRRPSDNNLVLRTATGTLTNNILSVGSNGRDQVAAFVGGRWIHEWFIWDGTTLATLSSLSSTAPTLPGAYTHQAYIGPVRYNATPVLLPTLFRGSLATLTVADGGENRVLAPFGTATTLTSVDCSAVIPPNALLGHFRCVIQSSAGEARGIYLHVPGQSDTGQQFCNAPAGLNFALANVLYPTDSSQRVEYKVDAGGGAILDVIGYVMPNGAG